MNQDEDRHLRVLMITKSRQNRGSYMRLLPFARSLSDKGNKVTLLFAHEFREVRTTVTNPSDNLTLIALPSYTDETTGPGMIIRALQIMLFLLRSLRRREYDVMHVCSPAFPDTWLSLLFAKIANIPVLVDIDDLWGFLEEGGRAPAEEVAQEILIRYGIRAADRVVVISDLLKKRYQAISRTPIEILWNEIKPEHFRKIQRTKARSSLIRKFGLEKDQTIILAVLDGPRELVLTDAVERLSKKGEKLTVLLPGWLPGVYKSEIGVDYEKEGVIYRMRRMQRDDYLEVMSGSNLILFLMEDTEWERARLVAKVPEFLASGTPLVSSAVGETRNVIEAAGYSSSESEFHVALEAGSIAAGIEHCILDSDRALSTAKKAREFILNNLSPEQITERLSGIYSSMVCRPAKQRERAGSVSAESEEYHE